MKQTKFTSDRPRHLQPAVPPGLEGAGMEDDTRLSDYKDIFLDHKWMILGLVAAALAVGVLYAVLATPVFRGNLLIQVEESAPDSKSFLNETTGMFEVKTPASGEIQILGSRSVLGAAVDEAGLRVEARPRYLPVVGGWLSSRATELSEPGFFGQGGFVTGAERIEVRRFDVPPSLENLDPFVVTAQGGGRYVVRHKMLDAPLEGMVGQPARLKTEDGTVELELGRLDGRPGAQFLVWVASRANAVEKLQSRMQLAEQGRQSNVIAVNMEGADRGRLYRTLTAIGHQYLLQNMARKSAEAEKTLAFLDAQLPVFERQLQASEDAFAKFRHANGNVAFDEEAKVWLNRTSALQSSLLDLQQQRREAEVNFTDQSPRVSMLDKQIGAVQGELRTLNARVSSMPNVQKDALRLEREVNVNSTLYQSMQNNALQMRLVKEGRIGNVRLLDKAEVTEGPVKPQKFLIVALALTLGLLAGPALAILRTRGKSGVRSPDEVESSTGLNVYAVLPHSDNQARLERDAGKGSAGRNLLSDAYPQSEAVEALRNLRIALRTMLSGAPNNRILITGATSGVGKSFVASNFAALLAQSGRRVLFIDADLRRNQPNLVFGIESSLGLSDILAGKASDQQAIHAGVRPNLDVLTTGALPDFPADMLESDAFIQTLDRLSARYDLVILDTAPVLVAADAVAVSLACGVVFMVARAEHSQLGELNESIRRFDQAGAAIDGLIFNGMDLGKRYNSRYYHRHRNYRYVAPEYAAPRIAHDA